MTRLAPAVLAALMCSAPALEAQQSTITDTIDGQIAAFLAQDVERAFGFASPMIRGMFRTPEVFGQMVRQGYPMVWRPADVRYGTAESAGAVTRQTVIITDQAGAVHLLEYEMIPMEGGWLINGVRLLQAPQVGA